ncbi:hypothetical protein SH501x_000849 [Pirellulaceae bacterium SH501]
MKQRTRDPLHEAAKILPTWNTAVTLATSAALTLPVRAWAGWHELVLDRTRRTSRRIDRHWISRLQPPKHALSGSAIIEEVWAAVPSKSRQVVAFPKARQCVYKIADLTFDVITGSHVEFLVDSDTQLGRP